MRNGYYFICSWGYKAVISIFMPEKQFSCINEGTVIPGEGTVIVVYTIKSGKKFENIY